jgi:hypothetical protein
VTGVTWYISNARCSTSYYMYRPPGSWYQQGSIGCYQQIYICAESGSSVYWASGYGTIQQNSYVNACQDDGVGLRPR